MTINADLKLVHLMKEFCSLHEDYNSVLLEIHIKTKQLEPLQEDAARKKERMEIAETALRKYLFVTERKRK